MKLNSKALFSVLILSGLFGGTAQALCYHYQGKLFCFPRNKEIPTAASTSLVSIESDKINYCCEVVGRYEGDPKPGNTHGIYTHKFKSTEGSLQEAKQSALTQCKESYLECSDCSLKTCYQLGGIESTYF